MQTTVKKESTAAKKVSDGTIESVQFGKNEVISTSHALVLLSEPKQKDQHDDIGGMNEFYDYCRTCSFFQDRETIMEVQSRLQSYRKFDSKDIAILMSLCPRRRDEFDAYLPWHKTLPDEIKYEIIDCLTTKGNMS